MMGEDKLYKLFKIELNTQHLPNIIYHGLASSQGQVYLIRYLRLLLDGDTSKYHILEVSHNYDFNDTIHKVSIIIFSKEPESHIYHALGGLIELISQIDPEDIVDFNTPPDSEHIFTSNESVSGSILEEKPEWGSLDGYIPADPIEEIQPSCMADNKDK